jgi:hypothetical protein
MKASQLQVDTHWPPWQELTQHSPPPHDIPVHSTGSHVAASGTGCGAEHDVTGEPPSAHASGEQRHVAE